MTELYLIRHGNAKKRKGASYLTAPLTELGRQQADLTGEFFSSSRITFDGYYSSPLKRACETALIIGTHIDQEPDTCAGLEEMEYREFPATLAVELFARTGLLNNYFQTHAGKIVRHPVLGRVSRVMTGILNAHPQGRVGVVAHGGIVSGVLAWYFPRERERWWRMNVGNCSITRLEIEPAHARLLGMDEVDHLGALRALAHMRNYSVSSNAETE